jgi:large subunit ribosomal protein L18
MGRAKNARYNVPFRRRREYRTDYKLRRSLLLSNKPIFTVRRSNRYIYVSISIPQIGGDKTLLTVSSQVLAKKYGWVNLKNIPAAYLTGLIAGIKALKNDINEAVINLGPAWSKRASIPFAAAMGAIEAGLNIPLGEEAYIDESRIKGEHISAYASLLKKNNPERYRSLFSRYLNSDIDPEKIPSLFIETKKKILEEDW